MIPHRSIDHIQKRSSGRSNSVSSATLKTPSCPTTIDHGWSGDGVAVAGDLRTVVRAGLPGRRRDARASPASAGRTRAATSGSDSPPGAHDLERGPTPAGQVRSVARADLVAMEALPFALVDLEEARVGPARDRRRPAPRIARSIASAVWVVRTSGEWTSSSGSPLGTGRAGGTCGRGEPVGDERRLAPADRRSAANRPGPGSGPRR